MSTEPTQTKRRAARPVGDETRAEVKRLHAAGLGRNQIARELKIAAASVTKAARSFDPPLEFDRTATALAVAAARVDSAAERETLKAMLLVRAREALEAMDAPALVFSFGGKDNTYAEHYLDAPPVADQRNYMTIAAIALQRHADLVKAETGPGDLPAALGMVGLLHKGLGLALDGMAEAGELVDPTETPEQKAGT